MITDKEEIFNFLKTLPDDFTYEELVHQIISNRFLNLPGNQITSEFLDQWIEISKLALEEKKRRDELQIKKQEIETKIRESKGLSAGFTAIIAAILGFATSSVVTWIQGQNNLDLERIKFEADQKLEQIKFETGLISKGLEPQDEETRLSLLRFYIDAGLINDPDIVSKLNKLIEDRKVPQATSFPNYEGRIDLGNVQPGDGLRFKGRGYIQITGRSNYESWSRKIGIDLVSNPERASEPDVAAKILVQFLIEAGVENDLKANHFEGARRKVNGGLNGLADVNTKTQLYLEALRIKDPASESLQISGVENPEWLTVHVSAILRAIQEKQVSDLMFQAYILATADHETDEGKYMSELLP